jgi:hypothetical protein
MKQTRAKKKKPKGPSAYARKRQYLNKRGGWGWEYSEPKPWKI